MCYRKNGVHQVYQGTLKCTVTKTVALTSIKTADTTKQKSNQYKNTSSMVMKDATPLTPLAHLPKTYVLNTKALSNVFFSTLFSLRKSSYYKTNSNLTLSNI